MLLAGLRPDLLAAFSRLRFAEFFPADRVFIEEDEADSATLKAVRGAFALLGEENACVHCSTRRPAYSQARAEYYLV